MKSAHVGDAAEPPATVLQEREVRRVGRTLDLCQCARGGASKSRWKKRIKESTFREDLYYRLNVIPIPFAESARAA